MIMIIMYIICSPSLEKEKNNAKCYMKSKLSSLYNCNGIWISDIVIIIRFLSSVYRSMNI